MYIDTTQINNSFNGRNFKKDFNRNKISKFRKFYISDIILRINSM